MSIKNAIFWYFKFNSIEYFYLCLKNILYDITDKTKVFISTAVTFTFKNYDFSFTK